MSHFCVLVIGDDVETQLQPYHEFECTGIEDQYIQNVDITSEILEKVKEGKSLGDVLYYYGIKEDRRVLNESEVDISGPCKYGYAIMDPEGGLVKAVERTNPNKKWDWWVEGGRWEGFLRTKDGGNANSCLRAELDLESMRNEAEGKARALWRKAQEVINGEDFQPWDHFRSQVKEGTLSFEEARNRYSSQPPIERWNSHRDLLWERPEMTKTSEDEFAQKARNAAFVTFALVKDSQWFERGSMGWFGIVSDAKSDSAWEAEFATLIDGLPGDTRLTIVDCHI